MEEKHSSKGASKYKISTFMGGGNGLTSAKYLLIIFKKIRTSTLLFKFISAFSERVEAKLCEKRIGQMSEKPCGYRHLTDKRLENEKFKVSVKCLFYLIGIGHLTYRSDVYRSDGVTPLWLL